ncbi:MAG: myxococcus cysteine-rich repeat containing protein, partial [Pseudomonadota bacterium]
MIGINNQTFLSTLGGKLSLLFIFTILFATMAFAAHEAVVTIDPDMASCDIAGDSTVFTINVLNNGPVEGDSIMQVEIPRPSTGIDLGSFTCGAEPDGWTYLPWPLGDRCIYVTQLDSAYKIDYGDSLNFTFSATITSTEACGSFFTVATVDDAQPEGDRDTSPLNVSIDCVDPVVEKIVGTPQILMSDPACDLGPFQGTDNQACNYWITQDTVIDVLAYENQDECNLGLDYCQWRYTLDDGTPSEWMPYYADGSVSFDFSFDEDSEHYIEIECYDVVGNKTVITETDKVDDTPPTTTKTFDGPQFPDDFDSGPQHWIKTNDTLINLDVKDGGDICHVDGTTTYYYDEVVDDSYCENPVDYCQPICKHLPDKCGDGCPPVCNWQTYLDPFTKNEESCHILQYYSVDALGNIENMQTQCFFVEDKPPIGTKEVGDPSYYENSSEETDNLCYKDADSKWTCYDTLPAALADIGYNSLPEGKLAYENFGPFLKISVKMTGLKSNTDYQLTLNGREGNDGNDELGNNCANPNGPKSGYEYAWECGYWNGGTGNEGFWNFDMKATTDASGDYIKTYFLLMPNGHYGIGPAHDFGAGFIVKEAADVPGGSNYPPVLMETTGLDWTIDKTQPVWVKENVTPITLSCEDQLPHPVGQEEVCYKISFDDPATPWLTEQYCNANSGTMEGDYCCADVSKNNYSFVFTEESMHDLEYYCRDALGSESEIDLEYFRVDGTAPVIEKTMIGDEDIDWMGKCPPKASSDEKCYVAANGGVDIAVYDPDPTDMGCNVDQVTCSYKIFWGEGFTQQECNDLGYDYYGVYGGSTWCLVDDGDFGEEGMQVFFEEDSKHKIALNCVDALGNMVVESEDFLVDLTPPETTKTYGEPTEVSGDYRWITSATPITLTAKDEKVGVKQIKYRVTLLEDMADQDCVETCKAIGGGDFTEVMSDTTQFTIAEDSCHYIEFYAEDLFGTIEQTNSQCVFVDNLAPVGIKTIGEPKLTCSVDSPLFLTGGSGVKLLDFSGEERIPDVFVETETPKLMTVVNVCDSATQPEQCAYVPSNTLPLFAEDILLAQGVDPTLMEEGCGDILILSSGNPLDADTDLDSSMGNMGCGNNPDGYSTNDCVDLPFTPLGNSVVLAASAEFPHYYYSIYTDWMRIGGIIDVSILDWESDNEAPYDNVVMIPYGPTTEGTGTVTLATLAQGQNVELRVADSGDSALDTILIAVPLSCFVEGPEPILCGNGIIEPGEECDDGNQEDGDGCSAQCLIETEPGAPDCWWVRDHVTEVTIDCEDQTPHPVQQETACYKVSFDDPDTPWLTDQYCSEFGGTMEGDYCCVGVGDGSYTLTFQEDSVHDFEFYCKDGLGNTETTTDYEIFKVDSVAPTTTHEYLGPIYEEEDVRWIDTASTIGLTATDGGPICAVGGITTYYGYALLDDDACWDTEACHSVDIGMEVYDGAFGIPEESCHVIQYYSVDALGNTEDMQYECVFVDKKAPVITKEYSKPFYEENGVEWISFGTEISIEAEDPQPHPSGVDYTEYRISLVDDGACWDTTVCETTEGTGNWTELTDESEISITEESCHLIEVYSVDNVQKDILHKQCVFVDHTPPTGIKTIGDPKTECTEGIDCFQPFTTEDGIIQAEWEWKITQLTPITLSCEDGQPHPVNHSQACYRYFLDGDTPEYLVQDWTCIDAGTTIYFGEDSMHQLEYYCEDALGNRGETDIELIKVEGANFDLLLNSKWNLISVPFRLFNDDPAVVFADVNEHIDSVWTYDGVADHWYVYRPNGVPGTNDLEHIEPGWGYWVYSNQDNLIITLGGSLMPTGPQGPPSKPMAAGWNLIGYYGASWELYNYMYDYESQCGGWDFPENYVYGDKAYCALNSLVNTEQGFPKWSGLWSYINCGNHNDAWVGINACIIDPIDQPFMRMYAGRGYWIEMDETESYSPATTCIWDSDFE